jgi:DNA-binding transcriptional LysR family regulator
MQEFDGFSGAVVYSKAMKSRVTLTQLRALIAIAQHGSYSEAALETMQSQSTLSHAISELEKSFGAKLLERGRQGAKLTALGKRVLEHAQNSLEAASAFEQEIALAKNNLVAHIRIMSIRSAATHILPPIISSFALRFPKVTFEFFDEGGNERPISDALREGRADVGILETPFQNEGLLEFELATDEYLLLEPANSVQPPPTWASVRDKPFVLCVGGCNRRIRAHWENHAGPLEPTFQIFDDSVILGMVAQGLGISVLPRMAIEPLPPGIRATPLPTPLERHISLAVTRRRLTNPAIREFVAAVREACTLSQGRLGVLSNLDAAAD